MQFILRILRAKFSKLGKYRPKVADNSTQPEARKTWRLGPYAVELLSQLTPDCRLSHP